MDIQWMLRIGPLYVYVSTHRMKRRSRSDDALRNRRKALNRLKARMYRGQRGRCKACGRRFPKGELEIHHVIPRSERPDLLLKRSNVQLLCHECHRAVHRKGKAE